MKIWGITGWKNTGKTGLTERLVAEFTARGLRVSTVKHAHHSADLDRPGTDSDRHRQAGAAEVAVVSPVRVAYLRELRGAAEPPLGEVLAAMAPADLILIEGYKRDRHPKIETYRTAAGQALIAPDDATIRAVASDTELTLDRPVFALDDTAAIADFITAELDL